MDVVVSLEEVTSDLGLAAADVAIEEHLPAPAGTVQSEAVSVLTDQIMAGVEVPSLPPGIATGLTGSEQVALLSEVKDRLADLWDDLKEWRDRVFRQAKDKIHALAEKIVEIAKRLGVSVERLLGRLQRRITSSVVQSSLLPPFPVVRQRALATFDASEINVTTSIKTSPSLGSLDVAGVVTLLTGLLSLELNIAVKYGEVTR